MIQSAEKQLRKYANLRCSADQGRIFEAVCFALAALTSGIFCFFLKTPNVLKNLNYYGFSLGVFENALFPQTATCFELLDNLT
jgi:hypothetical protein